MMKDITNELEAEIKKFKNGPRKRIEKTVKAKRKFDKKLSLLRKVRDYSLITKLLILERNTKERYIREILNIEDRDEIYNTYINFDKYIKKFNERNVVFEQMKIFRETEENESKGN